jgi:hypothetical protein
MRLVSRTRRRIHLGTREIEYTLNRKFGRRGAGIKVDVDGVTVNTGVSTTQRFIDTFLRTHAGWIEEKLVTWTARRAAHAAWHDGAQLPWRGGRLTLRIVREARARVPVMLREDTLVVTLPMGVNDDAIADRVIHWYKRMARQALPERVATLSRLHGIEPPPRVLLTSARTRWGSCNAKREVRLNWRLMKAPEALSDYIILHEMAHLKHMNHSPAFWQEVARLCPDYLALKARLLAEDHVYRGF